MSKRLLAPGTAALLVSLGVGVALVAGNASAAPGNPPGNNGTVKIDDTPFDDHPNNEPHVGCIFQVDFYGFDAGDLDADVTFEAWPPTLRDSESQVLLTDTVFIGEDDNSGGGSEAGLDASETYTLRSRWDHAASAAGRAREADHQRRRLAGRGRQAQGVLDQRLRSYARLRADADGDADSDR